MLCFDVFFLLKIMSSIWLILFSLFFASDDHAPWNIQGNDPIKTWKSQYKIIYAYVILDKWDADACLKVKDDFPQENNMNHAVYFKANRCWWSAIRGCSCSYLYLGINYVVKILNYIGLERSFFCRHKK